MSHNAPYPHLIMERCNLCGLCVQVCAQEVLVVERSHLRLDAEKDCDGCGDCEQVCSQDAIDCPFEIVWGEDDTTLQQHTPQGGNQGA